MCQSNNYAESYSESEYEGVVVLRNSADLWLITFNSNILFPSDNVAVRN